MKFLNQTAQTNWKLFVIVAVFATVLVVGGILVLKAFQGQPLIPPVVQQAPLIERMIPNEASIGAEVLVIGSGLTPTKNSLQFGYGEFDAINNLTSSDGKKIIFIVPLVFSGCSASGGGCRDVATRPVPGQTYEVAVINANGTSNRVKFTIAKDTTSSKIDTSTWQTYRNAEYGFEVRYPGDWTVDEHKETPALRFVSLRAPELDERKVGGGSLEITILKDISRIEAIHEAGFQTREEAVDNDPYLFSSENEFLDVRYFTYGSSAGSAVPVEENTINGLQILEADIPIRLYGGEEDKYLGAGTGRNILVFSPGTYAHIFIQDVGVEPEIFDQILSTFRFVP